MAKKQQPPSALTLVEILVVLVIIAALVALLIPAVGSARQSAQRVTCTGNIRQLCLGINQLCELHDVQLATSEGMSGGWSMQVLPYIEEEPLAKLIGEVRLAQVPKAGLVRPRIFSCPTNPSDLSSFGEIQAAHYTSNGYEISDAPVDSRMPWLAGPKTESNFAEREGPHRGRYLEGDIRDVTVTLSTSRPR